MRKNAIFIIGILFVVLSFGGCTPKRWAYLDGKKNEKLALEYVSDTYGIDAEIISCWAGDIDYLDGRSPDAFVMKEASEDGFLFRVEVFKGQITDGYPCSFIGNEISIKTSQYLQEKYSEAFDSLKCHTEVYTEEKVLLTEMAEINRLPDRSIRISMYIVSSESVEVQQDMLCSVYQYLQETFDAFYFELFFLREEDFQVIEEYLNEHENFFSSFKMLDIHPFSGFKYYKGADVENLERSEILSWFEVYEE